MKINNQARKMDQELKYMEWEEQSLGLWSQTSPGLQFSSMLILLQKAIKLPVPVAHDFSGEHNNA